MDGIGPPGIQDNHFSLFDPDAVSGGVVEIPIIPSKASHVRLT
jgi:hypothetical protein